MKLKDLLEAEEGMLGQGALWDLIDGVTKIKGSKANGTIVTLYGSIMGELKNKITASEFPPLSAFVLRELPNEAATPASDSPEDIKKAKEENDATVKRVKSALLAQLK